MWKQSITVLIASAVLSACGAGAPTLRSTMTGDLAPCGSGSHCVSSQESRADYRIEPLRYTGSAVAAREKMGRVLNRMQSMGYTVINNEGDYIHATHTSSTMKYVDDLEFVFSQAEPGVIHVRSSSRIGYADFGANRKHVEEVRNAFNIAKN